MARSDRLPPESVAGIVVPAWSEQRQPARPPVPPLAPGGIGWEIVGRETDRKVSAWLVGLVGLALALAVHVGLVAALWRDPEPPLEAHAPMVVIDHEIDLTEPILPQPEAEPEEPPTEPAPAEEAPEPAVEPAPTSAPAPEAPPSAVPPPPAQAGEVLASDAPAEPVDFTGFDIATGDGPSYAGGVTASNGTNTEAVHTRNVDPEAAPDRPQGEGSRARPVSLPARNWDCPWPREADALGIDEQVVVLRATVGPDGRATSVRVLADPGHGFGEEALRCARQVRFEPARDATGEAYAATSPPIRVRFTR